MSALRAVALLDGGIEFGIVGAEMCGGGDMKDTKPKFTVRVTRKEFLKLPLRIRCRALRDMAKDRALQKYYDTLDCEDDP